jgi:hypothetical protein
MEASTLPIEESKHPKSGYRIRDWDEFQHYKDRNPPWIKLHYELLTKDYWVMLDDASKLLAVASMMLASRNHGIVPDNTEYIKKVSHLQKTPNLQPLITAGFLIPIDGTTPAIAEYKSKSKRQRQSASNLLASASMVSFSPAMALSMADWLKHREEIGKPMTDKAFELLVKKIKQMGDTRAIAAINHSITNGWQGLFEPSQAHKVKPEPVRNCI